MTNTEIEITEQIHKAMTAVSCALIDLDIAPQAFDVERHRSIVYWLRQAVELLQGATASCKAGGDIKW